MEEFKLFLCLFDKMEDSWVDITALCRNVADSLTYDHPMISHPSFSLEACMSAMEVGNDYASR